ncbi:hypothetical protein GGG16DRAFT_109889 [Schizophyllum commune]
MNGPSSGLPTGSRFPREVLSSARSVVDRLPNEMLCAIFLMCGDRSLTSHFQRDPVMHDSGMNPIEVKLCSKTAVILGHVCLR